MSNEERMERVVREIFRMKARGQYWMRCNRIRLEIQSIWKQTDVLVEELADILEISMDRLEGLLDETQNVQKPPRGRRWWEQNFEANLPIFVPLKITGI